MLTEIFKSVLLMSAVGGILSTFLLCVKPITRKLFSPKWQYYIWLTVLIVMVLPVSFSLPKNTPDIPDIMTEQVQNVQTNIEMPLDNRDTIIETPKQSEKFSITKIELPQNIFYYLSCIWILGVIFIFFAKIIKYRLFLRAIHKNSSLDTSLSGVPKRLKVCRTDMLDAPLIVGLIKPVLYLPDTELSEDNLNYILMHELTHYKRHDLLYKWATVIVQCIHWFNPFIYLVSKQIDLDCEVSCDFAVTTNLAQDEQNNYMNMILGLLANSGSNLRPLTTQMASSKKTLKRRFEMIRNKKKTSKFVSVLSAVLAVVMLGTTVFASGVLSDLTTDDYTIEITNNGEKIELANKPFIENGEVYVPLRELFEKVGVMEHHDSKIKWNNGKIELTVAYYDNSAEVIDAHKSLNNGQGVDSVTFIFNHAIEIGKSSIIENTEPNLAGQYISNEITMDNAPVLKGSNTYIPYSYIRSILDAQKWNIEYSVHDKNGNIISLSEKVAIIEAKDLPYTPEYTIDRFFRNVEIGQLKQAQQYCADWLTPYNDDSEFFQPQKVISDIKIDYTKNSLGEISVEVYTESSNTDIGFIHWKLFLIRTDDDRYLINGYSSVNDVTVDENGNLIEQF